MQLQEMMRHRSIDTTLKYYVDQDAEGLAADLLAAHQRQIELSAGTGNTPGNNRPSVALPKEPAIDASPYADYNVGTTAEWRNR